MALKYLLWANLVLVLVGAAYVTTPLNVETVCRDELTASSPYTSSPLIVSRIAWPIQGPPFQTIPLINSVGPSGPAEAICMAGCDMPPCLPPTSCDPNGLWWSLPYSNLILNSPALEFSPPQQIYPQLVTFFFEPYMAPSTSPIPTISPTVSPLPTATATATAAPSGATHISVSCDVCDKSAVVGVSIMFGIFVLATIACFYWGYKAAHSIRCPYCEQKVARSTLKRHLHDCKAHLHMFNPVIFDKVTIIATEEKEDEVARPELTSLAGHKA